MLFSLLLALAAPSLAEQPPTLRVFAAASLKESFTAIARKYEQEKGVKISLNFAGSQQLAAQIQASAPADVFASASDTNLETTSFDRASRRVFALNRLAVVTPRSGGIANLKALASVRRIVLAAPAVPAGKYARAMLDLAAQSYSSAWRASVSRHVVSEEQDVRAVLAKVVLGEADAGIVYQTDARSAGLKVDTVAIPNEFNIVARYPVAVMAGSTDKKEAKHFVKYLLDPGSQAILSGTGFVSPLAPVSSVQIGTRRVAWKQVVSKPAVQVTAVDEDGKTRAFRGVPLVKLLPAGVRLARVWAADDYSVELTRASGTLQRAVVVAQGGGNYRLVVPGSKPDTWIMWIRRIESS
ncbi:MAG: molybdate ABC transporter substrate-binding protein [Armatimonadetes bacterium]|nr:molybdate ABC transporter substrate-binding protein [Armatimonadota bacterium]